MINSPSGSGWDVIASLSKDEQERIKDEISGNICEYKVVNRKDGFYFKTSHETSYFIYKFCPDCGKRIKRVE